jgi:DNA-binding beta-propeller fold protein YncE
MKTRKTSALLTCFFITATFYHTQAQQIIDGFQAPESVLKNGDKIFVSNIGGAQPNPGAKDGDGYISELSSDGKIIQQKFQKSTLNGPKGLAVMNNVLYASDIDRVVGFDINSGEQIFELNIPGAAFLNDLCKAEDNMLAVSESMSGKIYLINTSNKSFKFFGSIPGANGVTYDANTKQLYACGMGAQMNGTGKLYVKDINSKDTLFTELQNSPTGVFDGLEMMDNDHLLVSDWISFNSDKARLVVYDLKNHTSTSYPVEPGPADIHFDKASGNVYIPQLPKNRIVVEKVASLKTQ